MKNYLSLIPMLVPLWKKSLSINIYYWIKGSIVILKTIVFFLYESIIKLVGHISTNAPTYDSNIVTRVLF